jgi:para-aminobenzoate synthetase
MRTLLIDNYDSFTYNLYQLLGEVNGCAPQVLRNDELSWSAIQELDFDNIVVSPGPGRPDRSRDFGVSLDALLHATVPVLGVCLGHQGLAHIFGGKITKAPVPMHGRLSDVEHNGRGLFDGIPSPLRVVRYHSLIVENVPKALTVTATTAEGLVMGLEHLTRPLYGIQFHPESVCAEWGRKLLHNFGTLTRNARARREHTGQCSRMAQVPAGSATQAPPPTQVARESATALRLFSLKLEAFPDAAHCFRELFAPAAHAFWLDSGMLVPGFSRFSIMGDGTGPLSHRLEYDAPVRVFRVHGAGSTEVIAGSFFEILPECLARFSLMQDDLLSPLPCEFNGGYVGYLGYELKQECGAQGPHPAPHADAQLLFADRFLVFDAEARCVYVVCIDTPDQAERAEQWLTNIHQRLSAIAAYREPALGAPPPVAVQPSSQGAFELRHSQGRYVDKIEACLQAIEAGESYELCLTNCLHTTLRPDPLALYEVLRSRNPAPYAAFLRFDELHILCSSPERFLKVDRARHVESRPIKGTVRRGASPEEDAELQHELSQSEKNRAENLMIVDLVRNDLGRSCEIGSVHVPRLMAIESYATVHQMVSTVAGTLRRETTAVDAVRAAFPPGSMTGAPKLRTLELLDALEEGPRGIYSGAIGYFALSGACDLNVVIRTLVASPAGLSLGVGGAIVALSDAHSEFEEIMLKAAAPLQAVREVMASRVPASSE